MNIVLKNNNLFFNREFMSLRNVNISEKLLLSIIFWCVLLWVVMWFAIWDIAYNTDYEKGYCEALKAEYISKLCIKDNQIVYKFNK